MRCSCVGIERMSSRGSQRRSCRAPCFRCARCGDARYLLFVFPSAQQRSWMQERRIGSAQSSQGEREAFVRAQRPERSAGAEQRLDGDRPMWSPAALMSSAACTPSGYATLTRRSPPRAQGAVVNAQTDSGFHTAQAINSPAHLNGFATRNFPPIRIPSCMSCDHSRAQPASVAAAAIIAS